MATLVAGLAGLGVATAATAAAGTGPGSSISSPNHFMDTFDNNRVEGWARVDEGTVGGPSAWAASGQALHQLSNIYGGSLASTSISKPGTNFVLGNPSWKNYAFSADVSTTDNDDVGVVFRYQDDNNYFRFSMNKQYGYQRLVKKVDGTYSLLGANTTGYATSTTYKLQMVVIGSHLQVYVNGGRTFDVNDGDLATGKVGLYTWGSASTTFDNITVDVENDDFFTIAVVPDTQYAVASYPAMLAAQMKWLTANRAAQNVVMVLQEGDVVNDMSIASQWTTALTYYSYLGGKVPFVIAAGNHDVEDQFHDVRPYTKKPGSFNRFAGGLPDYAIDGAYAAGDYRNTYRLFSAAGIDFLVLTLDFGSNDTILAWAGAIADEYPGRHVVLLTHDYLDTDNTLRGTLNTSDRTLPRNHNPNLNNGLDVWQKFVNTHRNVQFTFNGHVINKVSASQPWATGRLVSEDQAGRLVYQTLTNFQTYSPGGQGFMRLVRVYPDDNRVEYVTYSPYTGTYLTDAGNQYSFTGVDLGAWTQ